MRLTSLRQIDFDFPTVIYCNNNFLSNLDGLPSSVETLYCYSNRLTSLKGISPGIKQLYCGDNLLSSLKELEITSLETLACSNNFIQSFIDLPHTVKSVCCYGNSLVTLSGLTENFRELACRPNMDYSELPWSTIYINGTDANEIRLVFINTKLKEMGLKEIASLDKQKWDEINAIWLDWKYRIGGEKYLESIYLLEVKR